jgi:hypothetical protein
MKEICIKTIGCKQLKITDNHDWNGGDPNDFISHTKITIKYKDTLYTVYDEDGYLGEKEVLPTVFSSTATKIEDGYYQITIYYSGEGIIKTYTEVFNKCNQDCKIDNLIADYVADDECDSCNKKMEQDILNIALKSELLCYAITCSNKSKVWELYNYINNLLLENNCKSC